MALLDGLFSSTKIGEIFSDHTRLQRMLDFEGALARAEARCGVIPAEAAQVIARKCRVDLLDISGIAQVTKLTANPVIPLVKQLTRLVEEENEEAARFVHWGATSQDVNDTGLILQIREAWAVLESDLAALSLALVEMAQKHRSTVVVGRTLMQHAQPTTFGAKVAGWLDAMNRHRERYCQVRKRALVLQFGGAVGTLAALKENGLAVTTVLAEELQLQVPDIPWHTQRDRLAETTAVLGLCTGTLGKIARDISLHMQSEIGEISEPAGDGRGTSSTMPQKGNPVSAARVLASATRVPGLVATMLYAMVQEDERGLGNWHAEWETLPEIFRLTAGALQELKEIVPRLEVKTERMRRNLEMTQGLVFAEAVSMALAASIGKSAAHGIVQAASKRMLETGRGLREEVLKDAVVREDLSPADLDRLFTHENYLGSAEEFVDHVIAASQKI